MRRALLIGLVVAGAAIGAATVLASGALGEDAPVEVITVPGDAAPRLVVEDGIARADAERLSADALRAEPGAAISVERDDGLFEVDVRDRAGRIVEVLLDDEGTVVGTDGDED